MGDATARIGQLLQEHPEGGTLEAFLPEIAETGPGRALHGRAAVAATFVAGLELTRGGALTLEQDAQWQAIQVQRCGSGSPDSPAAPVGPGWRPTA